MFVVIDANILVALLTSRAGRALITNPELQLLMTEDAWRETQEHVPRRLAERVSEGKISQELADATLAALATIEPLIRRVPAESYAEFMPLATRLMPDPDDVPTLALAMSISAPVWTADRHFWGTGIAVWTTERLRARLMP